MSWTDSVLLVGIATTCTCVAQFPTAHHAGLVIPSRIDGDPQEDFLVYDGAGVHAWRGLASAPYLQSMNSTPVQFDRQAARPLAAGRHLFVPLLGNFAIAHGGIEVFEILSDGSLEAAGSYRLEPSEPGGIVTSIRLSRVPFDVGNDGVPDVIAVWAETPRPSTCMVRGALLSWNRIDGALSLDLSGGPASAMQIAGIYPSKNLAQSPDELVMVVGHAPTAAHDRFGFVTLEVNSSDIRVRSTRWFQHAPAVRNSYWGDAWSPCAYGRFSPTPALAVPVVAFAPGPSIVFHPDLDQPYVARNGVMIETSVSGFLLDDAVADFDGDGAEEVVIIERSLGFLGSVVVVTDPHPYERKFQAFSFRENPITRAFDPSPIHDRLAFHGAAIDVNGDGRKDIVIAIQKGGQGELSLILADSAGSTSGHGLTRVY